MSKGRKPKVAVVWPQWALRRIRSIGFTESVLDDALKVGLTIFERECEPLLTRRKEINATWDSETAQEQISDRAPNTEPIARDTPINRGLDQESIAQDAQRLSDVTIGPGHMAQSDSPSADDSGRDSE